MDIFNIKITIIKNNNNMNTKILTKIIILINALCLVTSGFAKDIVVERFDTYSTGGIGGAGTSSANNPWYSFQNAKNKETFDATVEVIKAVKNNNVLKINAKVKPDTKDITNDIAFFFIGARQVFTADLSEYQFNQLELTAYVSAEIIDTNPRDNFIPPSEFIWEMRLEPLNSSGALVYKISSKNSSKKIGGLLSTASGGSNPIVFEKTAAEYQIVFVVTTESMDIPFDKGDFEIKIYVDNVKFSLID